MNTPYLTHFICWHSESIFHKVISFTDKLNTRNNALGQETWKHNFKSVLPTLEVILVYFFVQKPPCSNFWLEPKSLEVTFNRVRQGSPGQKYCHLTMTEVKKHSQKIICSMAFQNFCLPKIKPNMWYNGANVCKWCG